jgi:hypothetical protein
MGEKPSPSGEDFSMPRWSEKAEYSPLEGGGIQGVHATDFSRWWLTFS